MKTIKTDEMINKIENETLVPNEIYQLEELQKTYNIEETSKLEVLIEGILNYEVECDTIMLKTLTGISNTKFKYLVVKALPENGKLALIEELKIGDIIEDQQNGLLIYTKNEDFVGIDTITFTMIFKKDLEYDVEVTLNCSECINKPCIDCN